MSLCVGFAPPTDCTTEVMMTFMMCSAAAREEFTPLTDCRAEDTTVVLRITLVQGMKARIITARNAEIKIVRSTLLFIACTAKGLRSPTEQAVCQLPCASLVRAMPREWRYSSNG